MVPDRRLGAADVGTDHTRGRAQIIQFWMHPLTHVIARIVSLRHLEKPQGAHFGKGSALHFSTAVKDGRFLEGMLHG
jgi:hypothetical protein